MDVFGKSITGTRKTNQDKIYFDFVNDCFILAVADGVGGNFGGERASDIVINQCMILFKKYSDNPEKFDKRTIIREIYKQSKNDIKDVILNNPELKSMGTTLTIALGYKSNYIVGNIGDSRTYLIKDYRLTQISKDHSYLQEYKDLFPDQVVQDVLKKQLGHIITKSVNSNNEEIDIFPEEQKDFTLEDNEFLLLCSDGLIPETVFSQDDDLGEILLTTDSISDFVDKIIYKAYNKGSKDNISLVVGCFGKCNWK